MNLFGRKPGPADAEHLSVEQLNAFVLGQLSENDSAEIERHVTTCKVCAARMETAPADPLVLLFRQAQSLELPAGPVPSVEKYDFLAPAQQPDELGRLGSYRVLQVIGSGGMGIVFVAEDPDLQRRVALKVMNPGLAEKPSARERFLREARSMAKLSHPHVITIHQVGQDQGVPYLAMELLNGESLELRLKREGKLPVVEALRIGREVAEGLAAAHQRGLIHRDIKPSNLWLQEGTGCIKILDFGLVRGNEEQAPLTMLDAIVGTPAYMSPEQAQGEPVDPRGDLFSLGCVLYQCVTGELPFRGSNPMSVLAAVITGTPRPVRECDPDVPPAFAKVIERLLAKRPQDRFPDAQAVLDALKAVDSGSKVRGPRILSPRSYGLLSALFLVILTALGFYFATNRVGTGADERSGSEKGNGPERPANDGPAPEIALLPELPPLEKVLGDGRLCHWSSVLAVTFSSDGKWIASAGSDHAAIVWDADTGMPRYALVGHTKEVLCVAFDRDGKRLATGGRDNAVRIWDAEKGKLLRSFPTNEEVHTVALSADGGTVGGMTRTALRLWEIDSGKEVYAADFASEPIKSVGQGFAFSPDGRTLAHRRGGDRIRLIEMGTWRERLSFSIKSGAVCCLAFAPDSKLLALSSRGGESAITLWETDNGTLRKTIRYEEPAESVVGLAFSPVGQHLAAAFNGKENIVRQWELASDRERTIIRPILDPSGIYCIAYSPDSSTLATSGGDGVVRRWDAANGAERAAPGGPFGYIRAMALAPDGKTVAAGCGSVIRLLDAPSGTERRQLDGHRSLVTNLAFSPDGASLASTALDGEVRLWDARSGEVRYTWSHHLRVLAFRPDGKVLLGSRWGEGALKLWYVATGEEALKLEQAGLDFSNCLAVSRDGGTLATGLTDKPTLLWDLTTGRQKRSLSRFPGKGSATALAFSPDGKRLAVAHNGATILCGLWDSETGEPRMILTHPNSEIASLAFRPDGELLVTAGQSDGMVRLWNTTDGRPVRIYGIGPLGGRLLKIEFSRDGRRLAVLNGNGTVNLLRIASPNEN
jgi:WD40 repeat protein/serine/threonine protein kinase